MPAIWENLQLGCAVCKIMLYRLFCKCCTKDSLPRPDILAVCLGFNGSGKSTMLTLLAGEDHKDITPTSGFQVKALMFKYCVLNVKEIGGAEKLRPFWKHYYKDARAVIYVIDSACSAEEFEQTVETLTDTLDHSALRGLPLLIICNCQDKPKARSKVEIEEALRQAGLCSDRPCTIGEASMTDSAATRALFESFALTLTQPGDVTMSVIGPIH